MFEAFVYEWYCKETDKSYVGFHGGDPSDGYISSSHNPQFKLDFKEYDMIREIHYKGSTRDALEYEAQYLRSIPEDHRHVFYYNINYAGFDYNSLTPAIKFKLSCNALGTKLKCDHRKKISDAIKKKHQCPEYRAKRAKSLKESWTDDMKQGRSESMKKIHADPIIKQKHSDSLKEFHRKRRANDVRN